MKPYSYPLFVVLLFALLQSSAGTYQDIRKFSQLKSFLEKARIKSAVLRILCDNSGLNAPSLLSAEPKEYMLLSTWNAEQTVCLYNVQYEVPFPVPQRVHAKLEAPLQFSIIISALVPENGLEQESCTDFLIFDVRYDKRASLWHIVSEMLQFTANEQNWKIEKPRRDIALQTLHPPPTKGGSLPQDTELETLKKIFSLVSSSIESGATDISLKILGKSVDGASQYQADIYVAIYEYNKGKALKSFGALLKVRNDFTVMHTSVHDAPVFCLTKPTASTESAKPMELVDVDMNSDVLENLQNLGDWSTDEGDIFAKKPTTFKMAIDDARRIDFYLLGISNIKVSLTQSLRTSLRSSFSLGNSETREDEPETKKVLLIAVSRGGEKRVINKLFFPNLASDLFNQTADAFQFRTPIQTG